MKTDYDYFNVMKVPVPKERKTSIWRLVCKTNGRILGEIRWYSPWRQYCLYAVNKSIWSRSCNDQVNEIIQELMDMRRKKRGKKENKVR